MSKQPKAKRKANIDLWQEIHLEVNLIESCETMGGALTHFACLFEKIRSIPEANLVINQEDKKLQEEDRNVLTNNQRAFDWFYKGLSQLRDMKQIWKKSDAISQELKICIDGILNYGLVGGDGGYLLAINAVFCRATQAAINYKKYHSTLLNWTNINYLSNENFPKLTLVYPDFVKKQIEKRSFEQDLYEWAEQVEVSFATLLRFLKILVQYKSFIRFDESTYILPKNFEEFECVQYQYYVGSFLDRFKSSDPKIHPLTIEQLMKKIKLFVSTLQKRISLPTLKGPALKKERSSAAEKYCILELVKHVHNLSNEELKEFKKLRYGFEITALLLEKAKGSNQSFTTYITPTMVIERAGPEANRILFNKHGIVWHTIPKTQK